MPCLNTTSAWWPLSVLLYSCLKFSRFFLREYILQSTHCCVQSLIYLMFCYPSLHNQSTGYFLIMALQGLVRSPTGQPMCCYSDHYNPCRRDRTCFIALWPTTIAQISTVYDGQCMQWTILDIDAVRRKLVFVFAADAQWLNNVFHALQLIARE